MHPPDLVSTEASSEPDGARRRSPWPLLSPAGLLAFFGASSSIGSLLLYLAGVAEFQRLLLFLLVPGLLLLALAFLQAVRSGNHELAQRLVAGCWAGCLATLLYDLVRVPIVLAGIPVFKAISYFGTVLLNQPAPTLASESAGWTYHLSNGIGFALMYTLLAPKPGWFSAVLWGLLLEGVMLLTPYAEVFGYRIGSQFLAITISAHVVYGLTLWGALKFFSGGRSLALLLVSATLALAGIAGIGIQFHFRHAAKLPQSPPKYIGPHLYTTWDVPEPDRLVAAWAFRRFIETQARFNYIPPFSRSKFGKPFDIPEAVVRRSGTRSATEGLFTAHGLDADPRLIRLARMTHINEITPWLEGSDPETLEIVRGLRQAVGSPNAGGTQAAFQRGFAWLESWYSGAEPMTAQK